MNMSLPKRAPLTFSLIAVLAVMIGLFVVPSTRAVGKIKELHVIEGLSYTLTVTLDSGREVKVAFPGGELRVGSRCEIRRTYLFASWRFERYLPAP